MLSEVKSKLDSKVYDRCKYVIDEIVRLEQACEVLKKDDYTTFGKRMYETHNGLSKLSEVSCDELDLLVEASKKVDGVYDARMMGGGFGGCTINLVSKDQTKNFIEKIGSKFKNRFSHIPTFYQVEISLGAHLVN